MKTCIVSMCKNENLYLKEWLDYHLNLEFDAFYLMDNNEINSDDILSVISKCEYKNKIIYKDIRGLNHQNAHVNVNFQKECLFNAYNELKEFDWIAFIDIDEFLNFYGKSVKEFLSNDKFNDTDVIHLNWKCFGDNDKIFYENKPVRLRFTKPYSNNACYSQNFPENEIVKSIVRSGKEIMSHEVHTIIIKNGICKIANGSLSNIRNWKEPINHEDGFIEHYETKSLDEYIRRRCLNAKREEVFNRIKWYFNVNTKTEEKMELCNYILSHFK